MGIISRAGRFESLISQRIYQVIILTGSISTLLVNPFSNFDPISVVKMFSLTIGAFTCLGLLIANRKLLFENVDKRFIRVCVSFIMALTSTLLFSGAPLTQQIWGMFGRNTGYLTYFSLASLALCSFLICHKDKARIKGLLGSFKIVSVFLTGYALIQWLGKDPITWSEQGMFATLGNVNFLSAFLGMSAVCLFVDSLGTSRNFLPRMLSLGLAGIQCIVILKTGSIQGFMIFVFGLWLTALVMIARRNLKLLTIAYTSLSVLGFIGVGFALVNKGPFAKFIFQPSVIFRGDYMHAGWAMTTSHPWFGVGLDSYGDWYRQARGSISTTRNSPDRISNTAHNIYLDISSNGGLPLLLCFSAFTFLAILGVRKKLAQMKNESNLDFYFLSLMSVWGAYQLQSLISINQIGVGVWGWIFTGCLASYNNLGSVEANSKEVLDRLKRKTRGKPLPLKSLIGGVVMALFGGIAAYVPLSADMRFRTAINTGDLGKVVASTNYLGTTAWHLNIVLDSAVKSNSLDYGKIVLKRLTTRFPRDYYGWRITSVASFVPPIDRTKAHQIMDALDPFNNTD